MSRAEQGCPLGVVGFCALAGPVLHVALLVTPLVALGLGRSALNDPAVGCFLLLAAAFPLADLPTLFHANSFRLGASAEDDRLARRWGSITGLLMLATFWTALLERALAGPQAPGWAQGWGAVLMSAGLALRLAAVLSLGSAFITEWRVEAGQPLVDHHIYAYIRHPSEAGNLCVVLGGCLLLDSRIALAFLAVLGPTTLVRIGREDGLLAKVYGPRFLVYTRRVKRLIPGVY